MEFEPNGVFSVPQDSSCYMQPGWMCGFHFGLGLDETEEDAMNENYCMQVLRIMITKADTEMDELEKYLVFLQNELAWAEYDDWSEKCCNALTKKLDCLSIMVWSLKNKDKNDFEVGLLMEKQPAMKLHEFLKALLNDYFKERDKQPLDVAVLDSSDPPGHATELLDESTKLSKSDSDVTVKEEIQESSVTPTENGATLRAPLMLQEKKAKHSETVKLTNGNAEDSNSNPESLKQEAGHADNKKVLSSIELKSTNKGETKEPAFAVKDKKIVQNLSSKTADEGRLNLEMVKVQHTDIMIKYSCRNALKNTSSHSNKKKSLSTFDRKIIREEAEENASTSIADIVVLDSSLKPRDKSENLDKRVKQVNAVIKDSNSNVCRHETDLDKEMTTKWKSDLKVGRNEEVSINHSTTIGNKILEASSNPKGKGNPPKPNKPKNVSSQNICDDPLSHSTGLSGRSNSDSRFAMSRQARVENSDVSFDALKHMPGLCGIRKNSDSRLAVSRKEKCGNFDVNADTLQHATDPGRRRSNSDSALATLSQLKVGNFDVSPATGLNQRRYHSDSNLSAFRQTRGGYCDVNQKLCDFAQKAAHKRRIKESNLTLTGKIDSSPSASSPGAEGNRKPFQQIGKIEKASPTDNEQSDLPLLLELQDEEGRDSLTDNDPFLQIVKIEKAIPTDHQHSDLPSHLEQASLTDNEHSGLPSLLELQDEEGRDATKAQPDEGTMHSEEAQVVETVANDENFDLDSLQPCKLNEKRKIESNSPSVQEPDFLSSEMVSNSSIISKAKRRWKSGLGSDSPSSNQSFDREILKKIIYNHQREANEPSCALDDSQIPVSWPQKKRKKNSNLPILVEIKGSTLETDLSKSHRGTNASAGKDDLSITVSHSIDSCTEAVASSPYATSHLRNMKLGDLRTIAKEQKLRKYSKLRKDDLIEQIANKLGCC